MRRLATRDPTVYTAPSKSVRSRRSELTVTSRKGGHLPAPPISQRAGPARTVIAEGLSWRVFEVAYEFDRRTGRSLMFEHEGAWRRVRNYPENWLELSEDELTLLLTAR